MSETPEQPQPGPEQPYQAAQGQQPQQPGWGQPPGPANFNPAGGPPGHGGPPGYGGFGPDPGAPWGREPRTGEPYGEKSKIIAGVLQLVIPFGVGRFYTGHTGIAIAQLVTLGGCGIWSMIDGILILVQDSRDADGRLLRS
ncbi:TM2 domain-containing protein [Nocardioides jensenii]|uniref:TM2 domain-containing protein n=1 Tax=Nocardioides jensenii TaxID=1843 RepID=UPI0009E7FEF2|nr:TM2 domain-containing protein [Nocardioides jensenii]